MTTAKNLSIHNTWLTADTHFGHPAILKIRRERGLEVDSLEDMEDFLVERWNSVVPSDGWVVVLGDFCWGGTANNPTRILSRLRGRKILVVGNHDYRPQVLGSSGWEEVSQMLLLRVGKTPTSPRSRRVDLHLSHYPHRQWNKFFHGGFHMYGHTHADDSRDRREIHVGVDSAVDPYSPKPLFNLISAASEGWYPKVGGCPLADGSPEILERLLTNYSNPIDFETLVSKDLEIAQMWRENPCIISNQKESKI